MLYKCINIYLHCGILPGPYIKIIFNLLNVFLVILSGHFLGLAGSILALPLACSSSSSSSFDNSHLNWHLIYYLPAPKSLPSLSLSLHLSFLCTLEKAPMKRLQFNDTKLELKHFQINITFKTISFKSIHLQSGDTEILFKL